MTLSELKTIVDDLYLEAADRGLQENHVVVTTAGASLGARDCSPVSDIYIGMDWENWQVRIETEDKLVKLGQNNTVEHTKKGR